MVSSLFLSLNFSESLCFVNFVNHSNFTIRFTPAMLVRALGFREVDNFILFNINLRTGNCLNFFFEAWTKTYESFAVTRQQ